MQILQSFLKNKINALIGGAWPYLNGSLHLGYVAALLLGDILSRYRLIGLSLNEWCEVATLSTELNNVVLLYERIDMKKIEDEIRKVEDVHKRI